MARMSKGNKAARFLLTKPFGVSGVAHYGKQSRVEDEWHPNLRGRTALKVYREMRDNDSTIGASANIIEQAVAQVKWRFDAASEERRAVEAAKLCEECKNDMETTWSDVISNLLSGLWFGWASLEKVYKVRDGLNSKFSDNRIGIQGLFMRRQDTLEAWEWDTASGDRVIGWWQQSWSTQTVPVLLPMAKLVHFRTVSNGQNPEGRSLLRNVYRSWFFLKRLQEIEGIGFERNLEGIPVIRLPLSLWDAKGEGRAPYDRMVQLIKRNEHLGMTFPAKFDREGKPTGYDIELLTSSAAAAVMAAIREAIRDYAKEMAIVLNTGFQKLGMNSVGSYALSSDQTSMFAMGLGALLKRMKETLQADLFDELQEINGYKPEEYAKLEHSDIEKPDVSKWAEAMSKLTMVDLLRPDDGARGVVRDLLTLPAEKGENPDDGEEDDTVDEQAEEIAGELVSDTTGENDSEPVQSTKASFVPFEVQETARNFLTQWHAMSKKRRTRSVLMLARAKMLSSGKMDATTMDAMKRFFSSTKKPGNGEMFTPAWQYWQANGGDAALSWLMGR